jgi:ribosomal protein S27AE
MVETESVKRSKRPCSRLLIELLMDTPNADDRRLICGRHKHPETYFLAIEWLKANTSSLSG